MNTPNVLYILADDLGWGRHQLPRLALPHAQH